MARIVCVHGVGKQVSGEQSLLRDWAPALPDGLRHAGIDDVAAVWANVADSGDVVALEKDLRGRFGGRVHNAIVHNGAHAHDATSYLTDRLTGLAIAGELHAR